MGIRTPLEDFMKSTLAALPGYWQKLLYFGELRNDIVKYDHWGMKRRYGTDASNSAIGAAHTDVFLRILRTPLRVLLADLRSSAQPQNRSQGEYLQQLHAERDNILPSDPGGGSQKHFDLTLRTIDSLIRAQQEEDRPAAAPLPPPGQ